MSSLFLVSSLSASKQFSEEAGDQHKFHVKSFYMTDSFELKKKKKIKNNPPYSIVSQYK